MKNRLWIQAAIAVLFGFLVGCAESKPPAEADVTEQSATQQNTSEQAPEIDPNSMQAVQDAIKARENLPGKQYFQQACASCHNGAVKKAPHRDMLGLMTPEAILASLTDGVMQQEAAVLSDTEKAAVAEYLAGTSLGSVIADIPMCTDAHAFDPRQSGLAVNWGLTDSNTRDLSAAAAGLSQPQVAKLEPKWAVQFPGANRARSQPAIAGGLLFVGSHSGRVYALDPDSGCRVWAYQASGEVRTGITVAPWDAAATTTMLYFGDVLGNVYGLDAASGALLWKIRADDHPNATITASPTLYEDTLYIPVSALEVSLAIDPTYPCCTFRGSILAVSAASGDTVWRTYTIFEPPTEQSKNAVGTPMMGPSGAVVWNTPAIDVKRKQIYFGTGENMSSPATKTSDALFALDMQSGEVQWVFQATENDAWNVACDTDTPQSCPQENGPDYDFGGPTILATSEQHGDLVVAGQKSGFVHALNPETGALVWQTQVGRGGIQGGIHFGMAAAGQRIFVPVSDMPDGREYDFPDRPGMHAVDLNTGEILWSTIHGDNCNGRAFCHTGISQVPTVVGDVVIAGAMDGWVRAYAVTTGEVVWSMDSTLAYATIDGGTSRGGSFGGAAGPIAYNGGLIISSGYGIYNHMPGNLLMMLAPAAAE